MYKNCIRVWLELKTKIRFVVEYVNRSHMSDIACTLDFTDSHFQEKITNALRHTKISGFKIERML